MHFLPANLAVVLSVCNLASAKLIADQKLPTRRAEPSKYPYGDELTNEFQYQGWKTDDDEDKADGQKIHEAFKQWADFAKAGYTAAQGGSNNEHFKRWFGKPDAEDTKAIQNTYKNMYDSSTGAATANIKKMVLMRNDYDKNCDKNWLAYMSPDTGHFHVCKKAFKDLKQNSEVNCGDFNKDYINNVARTLSFALLHEFTHADSIADDRLGQIEDHAIISTKCFELEDDDKQTNANNYAWEAAEQYWSDKCPEKKFMDPPASATTNPTPTPPKAPYADKSGKCHIHVNEFENCRKDTENLSVEITMWDTSGSQIGYVDKTEAGATKPLKMKSKLEKLLEVTPQHRGDYIQFTLGGLSWASNKDNDENAKAYCKVGGWDPRQGPICSPAGRFGTIIQKDSMKQMDCYFECPWGGGKSTDA